YFVAFPAVREYMERTVAEARERGYTETLFGRRRPIPELASSNFRIRQAGERQAMNGGIQGLAADIFKVALVRLDQRLAEEDPDSRLILQVHDEVLLEGPPKHLPAAGEVLPLCAPATARAAGGGCRPGVVGGPRRAARAPRGQPLRRGQLGRRQGVAIDA